MPTTGWLWAGSVSSSSGFSSPGNMVGAPDGTLADVSSGEATLAGFDAQAAMGGSPVTITGMDVAIYACGYWGGSAIESVAVNGSSISSGWPLPLSTVEEFVVSASPLAWSEYASLTVTIEGTIAGVDAVGIRIEYSVDYPVGQTSSVTTTSTNAVTKNADVNVSSSVVTSYDVAVGLVPAGDAARWDITTDTAASVGIRAVTSAMYPVTTSWDAAVGGRHGVESETPVVTGYRMSASLVTGIVVIEPPRTVEELIAGSAAREDHATILAGPLAGTRLALMAGDLTLDAAAPYRATGTLTIDTSDLAILAALDPLQTLTEIAVSIGIRGDDGVLHAWQHAVVHPVSMPRRVEVGGRPVSAVQVADRSELVARAGMREHMAGSGQESLISLAVSLVLSRASWVEVGDIWDPGWRSGTDVMAGAAGGDPWETARDLAWVAGARLFFDHEGKLTSVPAAPSGVPVARWVDGEKECRVRSMETALSASEVVTVLGVPWEEARPDSAPEGWTPLGGIEWWEDDGPLGITSHFGERAALYSGDSSAIHSADHAKDVAIAAGLQQQGVTAPLDFVVGVDPRRRLGDMVMIDRPEIGVSETCRIAMLSLSLGSPLMSGSMDARKVV